MKTETENVTETELNLEKQVEDAKKLLAENDQKIVAEAAKEYNDFVIAWSEKHQCKLSVFGEFRDNVMKPFVQVVKI